MVEGNFAKPHVPSFFLLCNLLEPKEFIHQALLAMPQAGVNSILKFQLAVVSLISTICDLVPGASANVVLSDLDLRNHEIHKTASNEQHDQRGRIKAS
jgi:hypothetical protein